MARQQRILENGNVRITENGNVRILESIINDLEATGSISFGKSADLDATGKLTASATLTFAATSAALGSYNPDRVTQVTADIIAEGDQKARVTQVTLDVITEGESSSRFTQITADIIADVVAHTNNVRFTQITLDVIGEPDVNIITPSPLQDGFLNRDYSAPIVATGGLGTLTYSMLSGSITAATQASPVVITSNAHGLTDGEKIQITGVGGMTQLNGNFYYVDVLSANTFALYNNVALTSPVNGTGFTAYTSGGTWTSALPAGLTLNSTTGQITGSPTENGPFTFTVKVTDSVGNSDTQTYTLYVDAIPQPGIHLGIGTAGLGYTVQRGISGIECHIEAIDVGLGTNTVPSDFNRSKFYFPKSMFPDDQLFYLELTGGNNGATEVFWTIYNFESPPYSQTFGQPAGQTGRIRNSIPFEGPEGMYQIAVSAVAVQNDAQANAFRIVAPLKPPVLGVYQNFGSEIRFTNSSDTTAQDQNFASGDVFRTSNSGRANTDDGWTPFGSVWRYEADAWSHINLAAIKMVINNVSFTPETKWSEIAFVDIDDSIEFGFTRKISTQGDDTFLTPSMYGMDINTGTFRDGHRYRFYARSVKPDGTFSFNTIINMVRMHLGIDPGNSAEVYNRCAAFKRVYMPGRFSPNPEIYFQLDSTAFLETRKLSRLGPSTPLANSDALGSGTDIDESEVTSVEDEPIRSVELSEFLTGGHDYEAGANEQAEIVYKFTDVLRKPKHNYMF